VTVLRLYECTTSIAFLLRPYYDAAATIATPLRFHGDLTRTQHSRRVLRLFCACSKYSPTVCDLVRPGVPRYDFAASLLRPWRLCCVLGRSKDAVRSRGMCEGSLMSKEIF